MGVNKLSVGDIPLCPHCGEPLTMFMPVPELGRGGPVGVCKNDVCPYYINSPSQSMKSVGFPLHYRHTHEFGSGWDGPRSTRDTDNEKMFCLMGGGNSEKACKEWNEACDWVEEQEEIERQRIIPNILGLEIVA